MRPRGYLSEQMLNGARNDGYARLGYLTEPEFGYALACYCWLRGEATPAWITHLDPGPRDFLKMGLSYLARSGRRGDFPTLQAGPNQISINVVPKMRSSAVDFLIMTSRGYEKLVRIRPVWPSSK
jgi:hypothetical protein